MKRLVPFTLVFALTVPGWLLAQEGDEERGQLLQVTTWEVLPSDAEAWESGVKKLVEAAGMADIPYRWAFWQEGSTYTLVYPVDDFAYFDDPMQFIRSFAGTPGEAQMQEVMEGFQSLQIYTVIEEVAEVKDEWSYEVDSFDMANMKYGHMDFMWLKPGAYEEFETLNQEWKAFYEELGYPYPYSGHQAHFGKTGRIVYVTFIDNLADYYGKNDFEKLVEAKGMGERAEQLNERFNAVVRKWEHSNATFRRDMSYWPPEEGATN